MITKLLWGLAPTVVPFVVLGALELKFPGERLKTARGWVFNLKLALLYQTVPVLLGALMAALILLIRGHNGGGLIDLSFDASGIGMTLTACLIFMLIFDFFYYWWHRAQHEFDGLWAIHKLHHMDESLGVSTQMRVHWLEEIGRIPFIFIPMALIFDLPIHSGLVAIVITVWTCFIHANLRLGLGLLGAIIAGPQVHRIHHSRLPQHHNRNYAALFPIYDVIFRTYYHPAHDEYPPTGVEGEPEISRVTAAFMLPFLHWRDWFRARQTAAMPRLDTLGD